MADNTIEIDVDLAITQALKGIDQLNAKFEGFANTATASTGKATSSWQVFAGELAAEAVTKSLEFAWQAAEKFFDVFIVQGIEAAGKQEAALNAMNIALIQSGQYSEQASLGMEQFAESIDHTTIFSSEQVLQNSALIESIGHLTKDGLKQATQAAIDLAATYHIDLESASLAIGRATENNITWFTKHGIAIDKTADKTVTYANVLRALSSQHGTAAAQAETFTGSLKILENSFEDMQKASGKIITENPAVITAISMLSKEFQKFTDYINNNSGAIKDFVEQGIFMMLDGAVVLARGLNGMSGVFQAFINLISDDLKSGVYLMNAVGLASDDTVQKVNGIARGLKSVDISKVLTAAEKEIEDFSNTYKTMVQEQEDADDDATRKAQEQSNKRVAAMKKEEEDKKNWSFIYHREAKAFEDKTSAEKLSDLQGTFQSISTLTKSHNLGLFRIGQAAAIADAILNTFSAVSKASTATPNYWVNLALEALAAAAGAATVADIAATPAPSFAMGGVVPGSSFTGDQVQANVNSGEMILTMSDQMQLLNSIRGSQSPSAGHTVVIQGNVYADDDSQVDKLMARIKDRLEFGNGSLTPVIA